MKCKINVNRLIGVIYVVIGLFLIITNGFQAYAKYSGEREKLSSFYETDKKNKENPSTIIEKDIKETTNNNSNAQENNNIEETEPTTDALLESDLDEYVSVIKIPKINLEKGLFAKNSRYNNVEYNIMIHEESDTPITKAGNIILVAHSGTSDISFFKRVNLLSKGDKVEIYYHGYKYIYSIVNEYEVEKTGKVEIIRDISKNTLTMITCKHNTNKQIVVISELEEVVEY